MSKYPFEPVQRPPIWRDVPDVLWNDWRWQQQNRIRTLEQLRRVVTLTPEEVHAFEAASDRFKVAISPYYACLVASEAPGGPTRLQAVPQPGELVRDPSELNDPLAEEQHSPVPGLVHRYPDRALLYVTHHCAVYCRHCTRKRKVSRPEAGRALSAGDEPLEAALQYLRDHREVRDVILSGGDPLSLSDDRLVEIVEKVHALPHVEMIRLGTRNLVTLPQRVTPELVERLAAFAPIYIQTHFNHPRECTMEAAQACERWVRAGFPVSNQTVLLKGVNDDARVLTDLNHRLLQMRVRPYLLLQCDLAEGIKHFRTPVEKGIEIIDQMRGWTSGLAIPHFVVDTSPGGGKVALVPSYTQHRDGKTWVFRNYRGERVEYVDP